MSEPINLLVLDLSHYDVPDDWDKVASSGITGVIYKATQGTGYFDPTYDSSREAAAKSGLLWGSYHFADASSPQAQADWYLLKAQPNPEDLICLDWEPNSQNTMSAQGAQAFIQAVETGANREGDCLVYGSSSFLTDMIPKELDAFFGARRLWLAQYANAPKIPPTWKKYFLWQYSGDGLGPKPNTVPGIEGNPDCNSYRGSAAELTAAWLGTPIPPSPSPQTDVRLSLSGLPSGTVLSIYVESGVTVNVVSEK